nr:hypothetical protein [Tanacetum cinerariifolium]
MTYHYSLVGRTTRGSFGAAPDSVRDVQNILEESPVDTMADQRTMAELLRAPTEGRPRFLNAAAGGNLLEIRTQDVLTIIENKSKCLAAGGNTFLKLQDNIQGYVSAAAVNYNQGNSVYRPLAVILKKLLEKLGDPGKFLIPCGFSELKCKALADLAVILKKLPEKFGDPGKFLILCGFSELKCKALADLGLSINLIPLSVWKKVRVPLILGRPFLRTARALIDVHGEETILRNGDERLTLNMRHDTSSYSNQPQKESISMINIFNDSSEDFLEDLFATNHQSGNPTFSSHPNLTLPEVKDDVFDSEGGNVLIEKLLDFDSTKDLHPPHNVNPLSGSTTFSSPNH